jgi:hypothetical protein
LPLLALVSLLLLLPPPPQPVAVAASISAPKNSDSVASNLFIILPSL